MCFGSARHKNDGPNEFYNDGKKAHVNSAPGTVSNMLQALCVQHSFFPTIGSKKRGLRINPTYNKPPLGTTQEVLSSLVRHGTVSVPYCSGDFTASKHRLLKSVFRLNRKVTNQ